MSLVANERRLQENAPGQLALHAQAVLRRAGHHKIRVQRADAENRGDAGRSTGGIRQIAVRERDRLQVRHNTGLAENNIAFRLIVEDPDPAANDGLVVAEWRERETKARSEEVLRLVEAAL